jgi:hypothetical protein
LQAGEGQSRKDWQDCARTDVGNRLHETAIPFLPPAGPCIALGRVALSLAAVAPSGNIIEHSLFTMNGLYGGKISKADHNSVP